MAKNPQEQFTSKRNFHWSTKVGNEEDEQTLTPISEKQSKSNSTVGKQSKSKSKSKTVTPQKPQQQQNPNKKLSSLAVSHLKSVLTTFNRNRLHHKNPNFLGTKVVGTLFGHRKGHVHFAFQKTPSSIPAFLIELATPISGLVKEMASGLVRIALECDKKANEKKKTPVRKLLEEDGNWRTYCNGKKCGFAIRRECGDKELKILKAVEPISMGAGVLPGDKTRHQNDGGDDDDDGEIMYMRAKFERIVGSRDSEAFYMMNPDSNGAPELSIYLLRI